MLKISEKEIMSMEASYPGIAETIMTFENAILPKCSKCGSDHTADVQVGVIGRTIYICAATNKFKLIANGPRPGRYFCNACEEFFNEKPG
jgi:hypothetical protein